MAGRIPPAFIDDLLARTDIVELISARVPLRKAGKDYQARCPFHDEKTPSFTVSREKQFYHCFGCGAHGTAIGFLMEYDRLEFPEAVEELARHAGVEVQREEGIEYRGPDRRPLYDLLDRVAALYSRQLREHPDAHRAIDYLKARGLTGDAATRLDRPPVSKRAGGVPALARAITDPPASADLSNADVPLLGPAA